MCDDANSNMESITAIYKQVCKCKCAHQLLKEESENKHEEIESNAGGYHKGEHDKDDNDPSNSSKDTPEDVASNNKVQEDDSLQCSGTLNTSFCPT